METCSISKRHKSHGKDEHGVSTGGGEDRIGRLPDAMLCHILSFLETKDAVRTSVLSKRWRYVWTSVPCIDIRYPEGECFIDFVDKLLRVNTVSCLRKFSLSVCGSKKYKQLNEWISTVMERDVEEIDLNTWANQCIKLPPSIFCCKKLVILRLNRSISFDAPSSVYLPSLKILHLHIENHFYEDSMKNLLDGCPVLEELNIKDVSSNNVKTLFLSSSPLKSLRIRSSWDNLRIVIDLPNVEQLNLSDHGNVRYDINNLSSLVKLNINGQVSRLVKLLGELINTEYIEEIVLDLWGIQYFKLPPSIFTCNKLVILKLCSITIVDVPSSVNLLSLKILHLYLKNSFDENSMKKLLDGCPVIEELNIQGVGDNIVKTLFVSSSPLKSLRIRSDLIDLRIIIDVPNVEQLDLIANGNTQYDINNLSSLVKFNITIEQASRLVELPGKFINTEYIEEIVIKVWGKQSVKLPPSIFTCKKLAIVRLSTSIILDVPSTVYLPSLKILYLYLGKCFDEVSMTKLLDGCPVIEELNLKGVGDYNVKTLFVPSSSLKSLNIYFSKSARLSDLRIVVDVPNVEQLDLTDYGNAQYDINSLSSLVKLNINTGQVSRLVELLGKFTNTEYMGISFETMKILEYQSLNDFPMFLNLTHLEVSSNDYSRSVLPALLESMPNLVILVSECVRGKGRALEQPLHHFKAPKYMMLYLEEIEIKGFKGFVDEMTMIRYFLKNSMILKKLLIQSGYAGGKKYSEISQKLLTFRRSSPECEIILK